MLSLSHTHTQIHSLSLYPTHPFSLPHPISPPCLESEDRPRHSELEVLHSCLPCWSLGSCLTLLRRGPPCLSPQSSAQPHPVALCCASHPAPWDPQLQGVPCGRWSPLGLQVTAPGPNRALHVHTSMCASKHVLPSAVMLRAQLPVLSGLHH